MPLSGVLLGGRIVAIADVFDARSAPRPYRTALGYDEALAEIREGSGKQFDPKLVETFNDIACFPEDGWDAKALLEVADHRMYEDKSRRRTRPLSPMA